MWLSTHRSRNRRRPKPRGPIIQRARARLVSLLWRVRGPRGTASRAIAPVEVDTAAASLAKELRPPPRGLDMAMLVCACVLLGLGTVMVYSASAVYAQAKYQLGSYFVWRQVAFAVLGLGVLYAGWRIDYHWYQRLVFPLLGLTFALLVALLVPGVGTRIDGATRWFRLAGVSFQPSELAKLTLVVYLAHALPRNRAHMRSFTVGFLPHLAVAGVLALLVLKQPDLGNAAILIAVTLVILFIAGTRLSYLLISVLVVAPLAYQQIVGTPWRLRRLLAFLDPWAYRQDAGYQISESLISVGSGGVWGLGLGAGKQKLFFLPAAHTDFIFAIAGEELGFVGLLAIVLLFGVLIVRGARAAVGAVDLFGTYLAFGLTATLGLQAVLHMAVVLGLVPTKGITLPLVSYGGSSLLINMLSVGVLLNIAARNPMSARRRVRATRRGSRNRKRVARVEVVDVQA